MTTRGFSDQATEYNELVHLEGKNYLLAIGINSYSSFPELKNAVKDANDIVNLLMDKYEFENDPILLFDEKATRENIYDAFKSLRQKVRDNIDNVLIYYSGHGYFDKEMDQGFWIPVDAIQGNESSYIENTTIIHSFLRPMSTRHTFLVSDSCFSGSLFTEGTTRSADVGLTKLLERPSRYALCSGRNDEEVQDGEPGGNSPFAKSFMQFLQENQNDYLLVEKVIDYVTEVTASNYQQVPEGNPLFGLGHQGGQFFFKLKENEKAFWKSVEAKPSVEGFRKYLRKFPRGEHVKEARSNLNELEENAKWIKIKEEPTINGLVAFIGDHPDSPLKDDARKLLRNLEEEAAWQMTNSLSGLLDYLDKFPNGIHQEEAKQRIAILSGESRNPDIHVQNLSGGTGVGMSADLAAWEMVKNSESRKALLKFTNEFPKSRFVPQAREKMKALTSGKGAVRSILFMLLGAVLLLGLIIIMAIMIPSYVNRADNSPESTLPVNESSINTGSSLWTEVPGWPDYQYRIIESGVNDDHPLPGNILEFSAWYYVNGFEQYSASNAYDTLYETALDPSDIVAMMVSEGSTFEILYPSSSGLAYDLGIEEDDELIVRATLHSYFPQ